MFGKCHLENERKLFFNFLKNFFNLRATLLFPPLKDSFKGAKGFDPTTLPPMPKLLS
jgi:hypothetical protein